MGSLTLFFTTNWTWVDDPASMRTLDCESTAAAKLASGARLDYTGTTTLADLIDQFLPYIQNTYFLVPLGFDFSLEIVSYECAPPRSEQGGRNPGAPPVVPPC